MSAFSVDARRREELDSASLTPALATGRLDRGADAGSLHVVDAASLLEDGTRRRPELASDAGSGAARDVGSAAAGDARFGVLGVAAAGEESPGRELRTLRVGEMFAGVGGFRLGLEPLGFEFVWANQWEPGKKEQHAAAIYAQRFGEGALVVRDVHTLDPRGLPAVDVLVGGYPCQDYSVSVPLPRSLGLEGKKGQLWWEVVRFADVLRPRYMILENVDRMLISPAHQRGGARTSSRVVRSWGATRSRGA